MTLHDHMEKVVKAAKTWSKADDSNCEHREERLRKAVARYVDAEKKAKARVAEKSRHRTAAALKVWIDADGNETPYAELTGTHLYNIRRRIRIDSVHHDGIWHEVRRRASASEHAPLWGEGVPFVYVRSLRVGDDRKLSFRNVLTKEMVHVTEDMFGEVIQWSEHRGHGITGKAARELHQESRGRTPIGEPSE